VGKRGTWKPPALEIENLLNAYGYYQAIEE